jgi:hypothetical protein
MVVICGENNYKLDTRHVIDGVVGEGTREGEVDGLNTNNRVARKFCAKNAATCDGDGRVGWAEAPLLKINFLTIFKPPVKIDFHWRSSVTRL